MIFVIAVIILAILLDEEGDDTCDPGGM